MGDGDTKAAIILGAIECIEKKGLQAVTVRDIAKQAKVNVAAINYHFGSKDALLRVAIEATVDNSIPDLALLLRNPSRALNERLRDLFAYVVEGTARFPNIARAHLYETLINGAENGPFMTQLNALVVDVLDTTEEGDLPLERDDLRWAIGLGLAASLLVGMAPGLFGPLIGEDATGSDHAERLMALLSPGAGGNDDPD